MNNEYMQEQLSQLVTKKLYDSSHKNVANDFFSLDKTSNQTQQTTTSEQQQQSADNSQSKKQQTSLFASLESLSNNKAKGNSNLDVATSTSSSSKTSKSTIEPSWIIPTNFLTIPSSSGSSRAIESKSGTNGAPNNNQTPTTSTQPFNCQMFEQPLLLGDGKTSNDQDFFHHFLLTKSKKQASQQKNPISNDAQVAVTTTTLNADPNRGVLNNTQSIDDQAANFNPNVESLQIQTMMVPSDSPENQADASPDSFNNSISKKEKKRRKKYKPRNSYKPSLQEIQSQFDLPLIQAARKLNICETKLKRLCRSYGINRWPFRKRKKRQCDESKKSGTKPSKRRKENENNEFGSSSNANSSNSRKETSLSDFDGNSSSDDEDDDFEDGQNNGGVEDFVTNFAVGPQNVMQQQPDQSTSNLNASQLFGGVNLGNFMNNPTSQGNNNQDLLQMSDQFAALMNSFRLPSTTGGFEQQGDQGRTLQSTKQKNSSNFEANPPVQMPQNLTTNLFATTSDVEQQQRINNETQQQELAKSFEFLFPQNVFLALDEEKQILLAKLAQGALCNAQNYGLNFNIDSKSNGQPILGNFNFGNPSQQLQTQQFLSQMQQLQQNPEKGLADNERNPKILISNHNEELPPNIEGAPASQNSSSSKIEVQHLPSTRSNSSCSSSNSSSKNASPSLNCLPPAEYFFENPSQQQRASTSTAPFNNNNPTMNCFKEDGLLKPIVYLPQIDTNVKNSSRNNQLKNKSSAGTGVNNPKESASSVQRAKSSSSSSSSPNALVKFFLESNNKTPISSNATPSSDNPFNFPFGSSTPFESNEMNSIFSFSNDHFQRSDENSNNNNSNNNNNRNPGAHFDPNLFT